MKATNWEELRDRFFKECTQDKGEYVEFSFRYDCDPGKVFEWFKNQFKEDRQDKGLRWEFPEHEKVVITNSNGDTYTSKSEELIGFLMSSELKDRQAGIELLAAERKRQIQKEGWSPEHDDEHKWGELAIAAAWYALHHTDASVKNPHTTNLNGWPWEEQWCKPKDTLSNLVRAGALICAEIDRQLRINSKQP